MDAPKLDEGTLGNRYNLLHARGEPGGENFGYNLSESMNEANREGIRDVFRPILFGNKEMFAELSQCRLEVRRSEKRCTTTMISTLMISQQEA
jgi:hypothetical protein